MKKSIIIFLAILMYASSTFAKENKINDVKSKKIIIDVRTEQEYNTGNISGSILIPYDEISSRIKELVPDKNSKIILYCRSGRRSGIAEKTLKDIGYSNAENYGSMKSAMEKLDIK